MSVPVAGSQDTEGGDRNRAALIGHTKRYTPLHPEVVKRLIPYMEKQVAEHGHGPLFRHLPKDKNGKRSTYVARKIDEWMDGVIKDPNLAPNHSFRHYLKSELLARDVPERISDAITGHKNSWHRTQIRACADVEKV